MALRARRPAAVSKPLAERAFGVTGIEKREAEIAQFVAAADLTVWEREDNSFGGFMEECRRVAQVVGCGTKAP